MGVGLDLGSEIPPEGGNDDIGLQLVQEGIDIVLEHVVMPELLIVLETPARRTIGAVGIEIITELLVESLPQETTRSKNKYPLFLHSSEYRKSGFGGE